MIETLQAIVLNCIRHSDRASVMTVYTPTRACLPLIVPAGSSARSRTKASVRMPLALVEFNCNIKPGAGLLRPSALTLRAPYTSLYFNPVKSASGMFIAEFLTRLLRDTPPDPQLFAYIEGSLRLLDSLPGSGSGSIANFHLTFLSALTSLLGIAPDISTYSPGRIFDMRAGLYTSLHPGHPDVLMGMEATLPLTLSRLNYSNMHRLRLSRQQRRSLLDGLLKYYAIHLPATGSLRSPHVLEAVFDAV